MKYINLLFLFLLFQSIAGLPVLKAVNETIIIAVDSTDNSTPLKPSEDPFYQPPEGWLSKKAGDILKSRESPQLRSIYFPMNYKGAWQYLIKTTDQFGNATTMVSTIIEPYNADPKKIVSYSVAQDSSNFDCAVSYGITEGADFFSNIAAQAETLVIQALMEAGGYYIVIPDYEAHAAAFLPAIQSGYATLDSVRGALKSSNQTGIADDAKVAIVGYSGGSISSSWAAMLQPIYAPELKSRLVGASMGGLVSNYTAVVEAIDGGIFAGLLASGIGGMAKTYTPLVEILKDQIEPEKYTDFETALDVCMVPSLIHFWGSSFFHGEESWAKDRMGVFDFPYVKGMIDQNTITLNNDSLVPEIPIFLYHGMIDQIIPYEGSVKVYDYWCSKGIESMEFSSDMTAEHVLGLVDGVPAMIAWVTNRLSGVPPVQGCQNTERISNLFYPGANFSLWDTARLGIMSALSGYPLGPEFDAANQTSNKIYNLRRDLDQLEKRGLIPEDVL